MIKLSKSNQMALIGLLSCLMIGYIATISLYAAASLAGTYWFLAVVACSAITMIVTAVWSMHVIDSIARDASETTP